MAIAVLSETPNMTAAQYDDVAAELGLSDSLPEGCLAHIAGLAPDGSTWREISVWAAAGRRPGSSWMKRCDRLSNEREPRRSGGRPRTGQSTSCSSRASDCAIHTAAATELEHTTHGQQQMDRNATA